MRLVMLQQAVPVGRQLEEKVLLLDPLGLCLVNRTQSVDEILLLLEGLAGHAVPADVFAFVNIAGSKRLLDERLHGRLMARLGRANEIVERDIEALPDRSELGFHLIAV